jgi:hypothetical protein
MMFCIIPERFIGISDKLDTHFAMARGIVPMQLLAK